MASAFRSWVGVLAVTGDLLAGAVRWAAGPPGRGNSALTLYCNSALEGS
ncbi:hypothetical protein A2cp1_0018 [Anaeromyxobacter dehalogenans 2CP-1]|uniref:Uncharacterized protein n=1 Tax=Anaeromyxobacter dehalogenans (strain ATCC BAA-258 / DSM 21875 / 2CP-1) TaxID=455488 RepID=B8J6Z8_ANAD2|nr:hypothetical protein A2cp1_0018 [Anaeromyxobacter dehalogenans 2CP-1]